MIHILYITTNLINGKCYIGIHEQLNPFEFDGYFGSGVLLQKAMKKYGKQNFKRETLMYFWTEQEALDKESEIVNDGFINQDWNYNMTPGGSKPPKMTVEVAKKVVATRNRNGTNNPYRNGISAKTLKRMSIAASFREISQQAREERSIFSTGTGNPMFGKSRNDLVEWNKINASRNNTGRKWITDGINTKMIRGETPFGWKEGRT